MLPVVISLAAALLMNGAGSAFSILATAPSAMALRFSAPAGTMSSKHDRRARVRHMGGDPRAHDPGADDGDFPDLRHHSASRIVAMP